MIEYVKGNAEHLTPTDVVVETSGGVGYLLAISLNTYGYIQKCQESNKVLRLWVHESIREDAYDLFGFSTQAEREIFRALISVSGIGGQTARMILSALTPQEFASAIQSEDVRTFKSVKGIGPKAAARIIVELKDKPVITNALYGETGSNTSNNSMPAIDAGLLQMRDEAVAALTMLGFAPAPAQSAVNDILKNDQTLTVQQVIKTALRQLRG